MGFRFALLLPLFAFAGPRPADPPAPAAELEGTWKLVQMEADGKAVDLGRSQPRWIIKGNRLRYGGAEVAVLTLDPTTTPRLIDLAAVDPKQTFEGIYALDKDTLKVCLNARGDQKERPSGFTTQDPTMQGNAALRLLVFERVKADKDETEGCRGFVGVALRMEKEPAAVVVVESLEGSPAHKAGLKKDDVLLAVGGVAPADLLSAVDLVRQARPGQDLVLRINRDGKAMDVTLKVGVFPWRFLVQVP